jgi:hypothetical protein
MGWLAPRPGRFTPGKETRYPPYRRLGGPQRRSGRLRKISPPPGFDPRTVQPVASHYTDWATQAHTLVMRREYKWIPKCDGTHSLYWGNKVFILFRYQHLILCLGDALILLQSMWVFVSSGMWRRVAGQLVTLKVRPLYCLEMSGTKYPMTPHFTHKNKDFNCTAVKT